MAKVWLKVQRSNFGFFATVLSYVDKDNVNTREVLVFVEITTKYVIKLL